MKKLMIAIVAGIATFVVNSAPVAGKTPSAGRPSRPSASTPHRTVGRHGGAPSRHDRRDDRRSRMDKRDQHLLERIEEADSMRELRRYIQEAAASREEDVRAAMVDALERVDEHSPSDFVYFMSDPSEDVADAAFSAWASALEDVRGRRRVRAIIEAAQILQSGNGQGLPPPPPATAPVVQPVAVPVTQPVTVPVTQPVTVPVAQPVAY